ncbi:hypothetical protein HNQ56_003970 [Anaerotaenia torta]
MAALAVLNEKPAAVRPSINSLARAVFYAIITEKGKDNEKEEVVHQ